VRFLPLLLLLTGCSSLPVELPAVVVEPPTTPKAEKTLLDDYEKTTTPTMPVATPPVALVPSKKVITTVTVSVRKTKEGTATETRTEVEELTVPIPEVPASDTALDFAQKVAAMLGSILAALMAYKKFKTT